MKFRFRRAALQCAAAVLLLGPGTAHAVDAEHAEWAGWGYANCTTGTSSGWKCYYDLYSESCPEVAVVGTTLASCHVFAHVVLDVVPIVNAAGRVVGCTSGGRVPGGSYVSFDSTFPLFDNRSIDELFVAQVYDTFGDGSPGLMQFTAYEQGQSQETSASWLADGAFAGTCKRGAPYLPGNAAGTVDVQV